VFVIRNIKVRYEVVYGYPFSGMPISIKKNKVRLTADLGVFQSYEVHFNTLMSYYQTTCICMTILAKFPIIVTTPITIRIVKTKKAGNITPPGSLVFFYY
jgi:hypothetical protein